MKKNYTSLLIALLLCATHLVSAQTAQGCDGTRYSENIFDDVTMTTVYYGTNTDMAGNSFDLEMDIYQPVGDNLEKRPLMIWAHGGAFLGGDRTDPFVVNNCIEFAKKGFVTATISYRLFPVPDLGIPDSTEMMDAAMKSLGDMKAAIRHFRQDADTDNLYKIDPDYIIATGLSAGAIMAVHAAYLDENDNVADYMETVIENNGGIEGTTGDATNQSYSSEVAAAISLSGALHRREWMSPGEPPLASYHGTDDDVVPYNHGIATFLIYEFLSLDGAGVLKQRADDLGIYNYHVAAPGGGHGSAYEADFGQFFSEFQVGSLDFLQQVLCNTPTSVEDQELLEAQVLVYPNPAKSSVALEVSEYAQGYTIELYDQLGRQLRNFGNQLNPAFQFDRGDLNNGVYFLQINFNDTAVAPVVRKITFE